MKYIMYCRRSQDRDDQQTLSIESQKRALLKYAEKHQLNVVETICEDRSAYKRGRPKFKYMIEQIEAGKAESILTFHISRIARNSADGGMIITLMDEGKIQNIHTPERIYINTADDKFMMNINFSVAKKSSDDSSAFIRNSIVTKLEKGEYPGSAPYGYLNLNMNGVITGRGYDAKKQELLALSECPLKRIELDPIESPLIRKLIDYALTGAYTLPMLQEEAKNMGIKGKVSGKKLGKQVLIHILSNPFYTGDFTFKGDIYRGVHTPLMTKKEFEKVQAILKGRSRPHRITREYPYTMLIECPECKGNLSGECQKGIHYYRCAHAKGKDSSCSHKTHIRQDIVEAQMTKVLQQIKIPTPVVKWAMKHLKERYKEENRFILQKQNSVQKNINQQKVKLERLTSKWLSETNGEGTLLPDSEYKVMKEFINQEISEMKDQLNDAENQQDNWLERCEEFFKRLRQLDKGYAKGDLTKKRSDLQTLGARFILTDGKVGVKLAEPFASIFQKEQLKRSSEPAESRLNTDKNEGLLAEMASWWNVIDYIRTFFQGGNRVFWAEY